MRNVEENLSQLGVPASVVPELSAYCENPYAGRAAAAAAPLGDEPHIAAWTTYEQDAGRIGAFAALKRRFAQLRFPIRAGISGDEEYRRATLRGLFPEDDVEGGLGLSDPEGLQLAVCESLAGRIPVLTVQSRADFVAIVRAFTDRNEPGPVPDSMGACIVTGLNNWHRVALHRAAWEESGGGAAPDGWAREFQALISRKELYQDRLIILGQGPYSAVAAREVGLDETEWLARSLLVRREHEFLHYFTYRIFGMIRSNVFDELIADFIGIMAAFGEYRAELALRFLGIRDNAALPGARIGIYRGTPPLSEAAFAAMCGLARRAAVNLESFAAAHPDVAGDVHARARAACTLAALSLDELASGEALDAVRV